MGRPLEALERPALRRMMREHGEAFWKGAWGPLYDVLGGNPLAAMPSLHFATSLMAAHLLREATSLRSMPERRIAHAVSAMPPAPPAAKIRVAASEAIVTS